MNTPVVDQSVIPTSATRYPLAERDMEMIYPWRRIMRTGGLYAIPKTPADYLSGGSDASCQVLIIFLLHYFAYPLHSNAVRDVLLPACFVDGLPAIRCDPDNLRDGANPRGL